VSLALFWRRVTLDEALAAVRLEMDALRAGDPRPREIVELSRLLRSESQPGTLSSGGPEPRELIEGLPDPAALLDAEGRVTVANVPFERLFGERRSEGRTLLELTRSSELGRAASDALAGSASRGEFPLASLDKVLLASLSPLKEGRAVAVLRDITESKRLEGMRREFIGNASHELRTPVSAISGAVETLLSFHLDPTARGFVEMIARHAERLSRLTRDLLDLSRIEAGEFPLQIVSVDVAPLCQATLDLVRPKAEEKRIALAYDGPATLRALADRRAFEQILVNLLDNAVKYTPEAGRVTVLADDAGTSVAVSVFDTGPGIEPRHQARLFERFYRADSARSREGGGTGLGLAIVKHLAQAQGGQVGVESGQGGSRFWVRLPKAA
jgi:two-component system, OmpR family, phosphate regulon sensor histidine kinase PhoR